jgi:succinate-semialdehyde dehydrogenase/glutarate-semialdehyde dehydrogenase
MTSTLTPTRGHLVDGQWVVGKPLETIPIVDPASGQRIATIPAGDRADAREAAAAARRAAPGWAARPAEERALVLRALADAVTRDAERLAALQTSDNGKPLAASRGDVLAAAGTLRQYAELGPLHRGRSLSGARAAIDLMVPEPYGVAAVIVPWNDPLGIAAGLVGAALVTGNTVVLKPSERAPLALIRLMELLDAPAGVANLLLGDGRAGAALVEDPDVDLVCHVGSMATGRAIAARCGELLRKAVLELGGNDALVVDEGVDPAWAAEQAAAGAFANAGQICTSVERIYVHRAVAAPFLAALSARAEALVVGDGRDEDTEMGPLVDARHRDGVHAQVERALAAGATALTGGRVPEGDGFFYPPTVLTGVTDDMAVMTEETFGPVAPVRVVDSFDEGLALADGTEYGLAASVLTPSQERAQEAWRRLRVGTVKVNAVWGGAPGGAAEPHKRSGRGYGYGPELLDEVTTTKVVHYRPAPTPPGA